MKKTGAGKASHLYRVIYTSTGPEHQQSVPVLATSLGNAIAALKAADSTYKEVISVTQTASDIVVGS